MDLGSGVGQGQGMGKWALSRKAEHSRAQASWTFTSFLITFVLPIRGADVITCWTELAGWEIQFLEVKGLPLPHQVRLSHQPSPGGTNPGLGLGGWC